MLEQARERTIEFQNRLTAAGIETAIINDENTIAYLARFWGYLSVKFGRPTFLLLRSGEVPCVITPLMESEMAGNMTWDDMGPNRWENVLSRAIGNIGVELAVLPAVVRNWFDDQMPSTKLTDVGAIMGNMRMIKSSEEIDGIRQTGQIAGAMMQATEGAQEYEAALAVIDAGTRKAAGF
jgi:Xaa-Pro aminopeptidase